MPPASLSRPSQRIVLRYIITSHQSHISDVFDSPIQLKSDDYHIDDFFPAGGGKTELGQTKTDESCPGSGPVLLDQEGGGGQRGGGSEGVVRGSFQVKELLSSLGQSMA